MKLSGPGVDSKGVHPNLKTQFTIDCRTAGKGEVKANIKDEKGNEIPVSLIDNKDGTHTGVYTPPAIGNYKVEATLNGVAAPGCPVTVPCTPPPDTSKIKVEGLPPGESISNLFQFLFHLY